MSWWKRERRRNGGHASVTGPIARRPHWGGGRIVRTIDKALDVRAPVREVFGVLAHLQSLPQILPRLREAREVAIDRHHWVMAGPSDRPLEWDTVITRFGASQLVAWETPPGSLVRHTGRISVRPNRDGSTRVSLRLSFVLPPGPFGEEVASLLRADDVDETLRRWRASIEGRRGIAGPVPTDQAPARPVPELITPPGR